MNTVVTDRQRLLAASMEQERTIADLERNLKMMQELYDLAKKSLAGYQGLGR